MARIFFWLLLCGCGCQCRTEVFGYYVGLGRSNWVQWRPTLRILLGSCLLTNWGYERRIQRVPNKSKLWRSTPLKMSAATTPQQIVGWWYGAKSTMSQAGEIHVICLWTVMKVAEFGIHGLDLYMWKFDLYMFKSLICRLTMVIGEELFWVVQIKDDLGSF